MHDYNRSTGNDDRRQTRRVNWIRIGNIKITVAPLLRTELASTIGYTLTVRRLIGFFYSMLLDTDRAKYPTLLFHNFAKTDRWFGL